MEKIFLDIHPDLLYLSILFKSTQPCRNYIGLIVVLGGGGNSSTLVASKAVKAVASASRLDQNLERTTLRIEQGVEDEARAALAEALTVNKTLRRINLSTNVRPSHQAPHRATLGIPAYEAFSAMSCVNTRLVLEIPPFKTDDSDASLLECHSQLRIEQRLNELGRRRLLSSSQTTRETLSCGPYSFNEKDDINPAEALHLDRWQ
jgi:hypothetical protein